MKKLMILPLLLFSFGLQAQIIPDTTLEKRVNNVEIQVIEIKKLNNDIEILKDKLDFQQKLNEQTINSISNQLDSASYNLTLFGILFTVAAVLLAVYVTYIERKTSRINEENKELLIKNQKIKKDVEDINKLIQNDIYNLFLKIKREETVNILERLIKVPKDISNFCSTLLSRELQEDDFNKLKKAYFKLNEDAYRGEYKILFFQHFFHLALMDEKLRKEIADFIHDGISSSFENDIIKTMRDFATVLVDKGVHEYIEEINNFSIGLESSDFKNFAEVYKVFFDTLKTRKNRFDLYNSIQSISDVVLVKINLGNLLISEYSKSNPTESESLVFREVEELKASQKKTDQEENKIVTTTNDNKE